MADVHTCPVGVTVVARFVWRPFFIVLGVVSMAWLIPWFAGMPRGSTVFSRQEGYWHSQPVACADPTYGR